MYQYHITHDITPINVLIIQSAKQYEVPSRDDSNILVRVITPRQERKDGYSLAYTYSHDDETDDHPNQEHYHCNM